MPVGMTTDGIGAAGLGSVQREVAARRADGGIVMYRKQTIPQSKIRDFCQPLYTRGPLAGGDQPPAFSCQFDFFVL